MSKKVFIPEKQALVPFYGSAILVARLSDGRIVASLSSLCKMLKLAKHGQMERIRRNEDLAEHLLFILVETPKGPLLVDALIVQAIPDWAMGIQINQIGEEKRPLVNVLKEHAHEALSRALLKPESEQVAQPTPGPQAAPSAQPIPQGSSRAADSPWDRLFDALYDIQQEEQAQYRQIVEMKEWLTSLDRRVSGAGQGGAVGLGRTPLLSAAHLADIWALLRSLEQTTGRAQEQLEREMSQTFRVPAVNAIPDEQWEDVLAWYTWRAQQPREMERSEPI